MKKMASNKQNAFKLKWFYAKIRKLFQYTDSNKSENYLKRFKDTFIKMYKMYAFHPNRISK